MMGRGRKKTVRTVTPAMAEKWKWEMEEKYPGYLAENEKLLAMIRTLTGLRILYGLFFAAMCLLFGIPLRQGLVTFLSPLVVYGWYTLMIQSGRPVAAVMLFGRGYSIIVEGVALLDLSVWLPYPLIFLSTAALVIEFAEAVFCIYVLFDSRALQAIRLNRSFRQLARFAVPAGTLAQMAAYRNEEETEDDGMEGDIDGEKREEAE